METVRVDGIGRVELISHIAVPPSSLEDSFPYAYILVRLSCGAIVSGMLRPDSTSCSKGTPVVCTAIEGGRRIFATEI
ncbi:MAG: hypothetical protein QXP70_03230 [Methanomassiliicoccales archaeon]